jgi:ribosomal protein S2
MKDGFHIIDLEQSVVFFRRAFHFIQRICSLRGSIFYVPSFFSYVSPSFLSQLHSFNTHLSLHSSRSRDLLYSLIHFHNPFLLFPEALFVLHVNSNLLLIKESIKLQIPIIAIVDSNCNPYGIHYPIPGNDDSNDSISFWAELLLHSFVSSKKTELKSLFLS